MIGTPIEILLVEDNPGDVRLTQEVFRDCRLLNHLSVARDGEEAIDLLRRSDRPRPDLILLDLNLLRRDGREVLAEIKSDPDLKRIPVLILTSSSAERDIARGYDLHANCYLTKPVQLEMFVQVVHAIGDLWLMIAKLPRSR
jgi:two-component system, chemotaxis family, response regulator Rcp1